MWVLMWRTKLGGCVDIVGYGEGGDRGECGGYCGGGSGGG